MALLSVRIYGENVYREHTDVDQNKAIAYLQGLAEDVCGDIFGAAKRAGKREPTKDDEIKIDFKNSFAVVYRDYKLQIYLFDS